MKKIFPIIIFFVIIVLAGFVGIKELENGKEVPTPEISKYAELHSDKGDLLLIETPKPNDVVKNPMEIRGQARGTWFFEGDFPVIITDWDGLIIGQGIATAQGEWMTTEFVPFTATIEFKTPPYKNNGSLILKKDNPSGLAQYDDALEIPILFSQ